MFVKSKRQDRIVNLEYVESIWIEKDDIFVRFERDGEPVYRPVYRIRVRGVSGGDYVLATYDTQEEAERHLEIIQTYVQPVEAL
jgi:hypothetical protein